MCVYMYIYKYLYMRECILQVLKIGGLRVGHFIISCMGCLLCVRAQFGLTHAPLIGHFHGFCNMYGPQTRAGQKRVTSPFRTKAVLEARCLTHVCDPSQRPITPKQL